MGTGAIIFLCLYILTSGVHLFASKKRNANLRNKTKWPLLPLLAGWYCCVSAPPSALVLFALATSWIGDLLLMKHGFKAFVAGGTSFGLSHIFFSLTYLSTIDISQIKHWIVIPFALIYLGVITLVYFSLRNCLKTSQIAAMIVYLIANATMNCFALIRMLLLQTPGSAFTAIGAVLFFVSDTMLFHVRFKKEGFLKTHFGVMLTYVAAEWLILFGLVS